MLFNNDDINKAKRKIEDEQGMFGVMMSVAGVTDYDEKNQKCCCLWHAENTPSLIFNPKSENLSAHCFGACHRNYDLIDVLMMKNKYSYAEAVKDLFEIADLPYSFGELGVKSLRDYRYPKRDDCGNKNAVYSYLKLRGISESTVDYLDICQDSHGNIVFNYYDLNDVLTMVKYRPSHKIVKGSGEAKNWCQKNADTKPLLFNMNRINPSQPMLICSGELDCAAAIESGWVNAVSIPLGDGNTKWIECNFDWLETINQIIIAADNDESGRKYLAEIVPRLGSWRTKVVNVPDDCKDLNEVLYKKGKDVLFDIIVNAADTPVPSVADLSDVKALNFKDMPGVKTGIKAIDQELVKLPYGTLTVISGMPGVGKSSLLSQIICNVLDQGVNTWMYSAELSNPITKSWLSFVLGGRRHIEEIQCGEDTYYTVNDKAIEKINEYYRGRWFVYKDDWENNIDILIDSMTDSIRKFGTKLLLLDNMMTMLSDSSENELREQTSVIKKLITLAQKYSVAIILVAHPRKLSQTSTVGMYDIAGSSNIANLAHRTLGLRRVTQDEKDGNDQNSNLKPELKKYDVVVNIIKDRMRGRSSISHGLYYDTVSRRFYSTQEEFDKQYDWDDTKYETALLSERILQEENDSEVFGEVKGGD